MVEGRPATSPSLRSIEADAAKLRRDGRRPRVPPHVQQPGRPAQLLPRHPGRRRRHRGLRLGGDAAAPVPEVLRAQGLQGRAARRERRRRRRHQERDASRSRATTRSASCAPRPACTAWCARARSTPRAAATPVSPACSSTPRSTTRSRSRSTRPTCAPTPSAPAAPAASTSTRPTRRCA